MVYRIYGCRESGNCYKMQFLSGGQGVVYGLVCLWVRLGVLPPLTLLSLLSLF